MKTFVFDKDDFEDEYDLCTYVIHDLSNGQLSFNDNESFEDQILALQKILSNKAHKSIKIIFKNYDKTQIKFKKDVWEYRYDEVIDSVCKLAKENPSIKVEFVDDKFVFKNLKTNSIKCLRGLLEKRTITFDVKKYSSYKDFYDQIYRELQGKVFPEWKNYPNLFYSTTLLKEFLNFFASYNYVYSFINLNFEKFSFIQTEDDFYFDAIISVFKKFKEEHPSAEVHFSEHKEKKEKYIYVAFVENGYGYIYSPAIPCSIGNVVEAPTNNYTLLQEAYVVGVAELADWELPIAKEKILTISKKISEKDSTFKFNRLGFIENHIDKELIKEWGPDFKNDWVECWRSSFGGTISYEKDGVMEVYFGDLASDDHFFEYTITSKSSFNIKLSYVQTITSQLFHNIITEEEFLTLFHKLP